MSEENFKEIINKRFNEKMEIEYALKFNFDEIVKKVINVKYKDDELKILQKIIEKQQEEIEGLRHIAEQYKAIAPDRTSTVSERNL